MRLKALALGFMFGITTLFVGTSLLADEMDNCKDFADRYVGPVTEEEKRRSGWL
jgi:hypothetical protein